VSLIPSTGAWPENISLDDKQSWIKQNQHVCFYPYNTYFGLVNRDSNLEISCCCNLSPTPDLNVQAVRTTIEQGQLNSRCQSCYRSEAEIGSSERTMNLLNVSPRELNNFLETASTDTYEFRIKFSNLCNLACRTCQGENSSKYATLFRIPMPRVISEDIGENENFWTDLTCKIQQKIEEKRAVTIFLLGGEPMMQPGALRLIDWLIQTDLSQYVTLHVTTNLTRLNQKIINTFDQFATINVHASVDSVGQNYEYIRWPAKFSEVEENLQLIENRLHNAQFVFVVQPVWSLNNVFYIEDFLDWWHAWFQKNKCSNIRIKNVSMSYPTQMTIQNLPVAYRPKLLQILQLAIQHPIFDNVKQTDLKKWIAGIIEFLQTTTVVHDQFDNFLSFTARYDLLTNTNFQTGNSRLYDLLDSTHRQYFLTGLNTQSAYLRK
jgi:organic radical activating enzyme